jgi:hypothetical protein
MGSAPNRSPGETTQGSYPLARRYCALHAAFTTFLMSTGLAFGTIMSLYGLNQGIIDETQFSLLLAAVVLSAIVPTVIARIRFQPEVDDQRLSREPAVGRPVLEGEGG